MEKERETLKLTISQLEGSKAQQERVLEKLSKEVKTFAWSLHFLFNRCFIVSLHDPPQSLTLCPCSALSCQHQSLMASSREEAQALRVQLEEQRERARREMQEAQRHGSSAQSELDRSHMNLKRLEEEVRVRCQRRRTLTLVVSSMNDDCFFLPTGTSHSCHCTQAGALCGITCKKKEVRLIIIWPEIMLHDVPIR